MLATAGISLLLSNTATTALMVQIVKVVLDRLEVGSGSQSGMICRSDPDTQDSLGEQNSRAGVEVWNEPQNEDASVYQTEAVDREICRTDPTNDRDVVKEYLRYISSY